MKIFSQEPLKSLEFDVSATLKKLLPNQYQNKENYSSQSESVDEINVQELSPKKSKVDDFDDLMDDVNQKVLLPKSKSTIESEIEAYKTESLNSKFKNPLDYWKNSNFEILKSIAYSVFVIPASSAEPERHNSSAGLTMTELRNRLDQKTMENLVPYKCFLNDFDN